MRKDDDVEIPSLTLDQDEVSERRHSATVTKGRPVPSSVRPAHAPAVVHKKANLLGVYLLLLLILMASVGAGYWLWQQNRQLRNELYGAKSEIENLDHQLLAADVSANEQGETLEEILKSHDSEIRKLWGVAYDTNRKAIASNAANVEDVQKKLSVLRETLSTQSKLVAIQSEAFSDIEAGYNKLIPSVSAIDSTVQDLATKQDQQAKLIAAQVGQNEAQTLSLDQVLQSLATLEEKVTAIEKQAEDATAGTDIQQTLDRHQNAIDSSDAFRVQVNSEIIRLRKQINQLMLEQQLNAQ
ncbi:hypothetical protein HGG82_01780 [Marinomonas sp. M1K-6]|uniref:Uncharacterized protein n=1 Tax=Marinomonas profundi TaxID=2726122 RepID=A0A847R268_9GAMM|nr:hypothetical protein [Marinomonas profundi]NLQ16353.1 hypothetical protein [Marinomonas profundi]UDV03072.1 hypothetical protein J8N69_16215 [Marinomonas profundi]